MIKSNLVKNITKKNFNKRIGIQSLKKLDQLAEEYIINKLKTASRKADISGRVTIIASDID
ncbi:MAG TPA: hypothetical protein P5277_02285 [Candidatus Paceibacterota bacterium]|nr:hypothetical protein [Candidatus Paceibacterota bacterium]